MKFTIITVVKNRKEDLIATINSVLSQKYKNFEYIVFDGYSTDGTKELININYKGRFKYIYKKDKNLYDALNRSIVLSKGSYIGILHAGDIFYSDNLLSNINKKISKEYDFIFGDLIFYNKYLKIKRVWKCNVKNLNKFNCFKIPHTTLFVNKNLFLNKRLYYNIKYDISSDLDFIIKLVNISTNYLYIKNFFICMKMGGLSTSYNHFLRKTFQDMVIYIEHFHLFFILILFKKILFKLKSLFFKKKTSRILINNFFRNK